MSISISMKITDKSAKLWTTHFFFTDCNKIGLASMTEIGKIKRVQISNGEWSEAWDPQILDLMQDT